MKPPPGAPVDMVVPATSQTIFTIAVFALAFAVLVISVRGPLRHHDWAELRFRLLVLFGGASGALLFEAAEDRVGGVWYAAPGQWRLIELFGIHVQLWVLPAYLVFVGGFALFVIEQARRGAAPAMFMKVAVAVILSDLLVELPLIRLGKLYAYYGSNQPLFNPTWFALPAWYFTTNALVCIAPGVLVLAMMSTRQRHIEWAIPFVMVGGCYTTYGMVAWPVILAIQSGLPILVTTLAALLTIGLGAGALHIAAQLAPKLARMSGYGETGSTAISRSGSRRVAPPAPGGRPVMSKPGGLS